MKNKTPIRPAKPPTIYDTTLRLFIQDLLDNGRIRIFKQFAQGMGYQNSQTLNSFLKEQRNFAKGKIDVAIRFLVDHYGAREAFFATGKGALYQVPPPPEPEEPEADLSQLNILSVKQLRSLNLLKQKNKELEDQVKLLQQLVAEKDNVIDLQKKLIKK